MPGCTALDERSHAQLKSWRIYASSGGALWRAWQLAEATYVLRNRPDRGNEYGSTFEPR
jgi:hypothetical protein